MILTLQEHKSSSYAPRTYYNASQGVTLAVAVDFTTTGEKLTKKAAGDKIVSVQWGADVLTAAREIYKSLRKHKCNVVNIAGNGIYTYSKHGVKQAEINQYIYSVLKLVSEHWQIDRIVSGGQTGADMSGLVAGVALGINTEAMYPKGYKMRWEDGIDVKSTKEDIERLVYAFAEEIINEGKLK